MFTIHLPADDVAVSASRYIVVDRDTETVYLRTHDDGNAVAVDAAITSDSVIELMQAVADELTEMDASHHDIELLVLGWS
ncbi:hypothetical protein [Luteococcus peritonei]|uniref:DUF1876 domain-containing protein n=1 Tax=Luteococcus peritonei TaxID=88874 RepID=A0ABW4RVE3_9ACTN